MAAASPSAPRCSGTPFCFPLLRPHPSAKPYFKGSYVSPESDATDERNQKELNFSLDEARVIAEINPQMLSLRELYTVAISYKNTPEQFFDNPETDRAKQFLNSFHYETVKNRIEENRIFYKS